MPKITFIKNIDNEIIYPKTHEDAILTKDGYSIPEKFESVKKSISKKADEDHVHYYDDLLGIPPTFIAEGGNADTVNNRSVHDDRVGEDYLWTSQKVKTELDSVTNTLTNSINSKTYIEISPTAPSEAQVWIDTSNNVIKYKNDDGQWIPLTFNISFNEIS